MKKEPKVLVGAPTYSMMKYCNKAFLDSLKALTYPNYEVLLVENSSTNEFFQELEKVEGISVLKYRKSKEIANLDKVVGSRNLILKHAIDHDFDYVLMLDSDVILPKDTIQTLISCEKDIISGLYYNHFNTKPHPQWLPVCWRLLKEEEFLEMRQKYNLPAHLKRENIPRHLTEEEAKSGQIIEVFHPSAGCMLLSKPAFSSLEYGVEYKENKRISGDDVYFIKKARETGFKIWCNTKVLCEHLVQGKYRKDEKGNLIHPMYSDQPRSIK